MTARPKHKRLIDKAHLKRVAALSCCSCGARDGTVVAHHKTGAEMGMKADDTQTMPLCHGCHHGPHHTLGVKRWEMAYGTQDCHIAATLRRLYNEIMI